jgi:hypothetical protein
MQHPTQTRASQQQQQQQQQQHSGTSAASVREVPMISSLSGEPMDTGTFTHNNMVPFFGSNVRQNVDTDGSATRMHLHTGTQEFEIAKHEITPMFDSVQNMTHVHGTPSSTEDTRDRFFKSNRRQGEKPFTSTQVGPGLDDGYSSKPSGGFHQADSRDHIMPKSVDELRAANNPKTTFKEPVIPGKAKVLRRGIYGEFAKNKPDRHYKNSPARYMTTVGAVTGNRHRSQPIDKMTNRQARTREHTGASGPGAGQQTRASQRAQGYSTPFRHQHKATGLRNAVSTGGWGAEKQNADYGKDGLEVLPTERDSTQKSNYLASAVGLVKAIIAPVQDALRTTRKENVIGNPRQAGNMQSRVQKAPVKDPSDRARTTAKETTIHNSHEGFVGSAHKAGKAYDSNDVARTTIKQTMIHDARTGNMGGGHSKHVVYDPNDVARTTLKETNVENTSAGVLSSAVRKGLAYDPSDVAATTLKETNIHNARDGVLTSAVRKGAAYDPSDVASTTIKETNIHNARDGAMASRVRKGAAYDPADVAATTLKETNIHNSRDGVLRASVQKGAAYDPSDVAQTTLKETNIHNTRDGAMGGGLVRGMVYDPNDVMPTTIKETNIDNARDGAVAGAARKGMAYDPSDVASTTLKETNIHNSRDGAMDSAVRRGLVYDPTDVAPTTIKETNIHNARTGAVGSAVRKGAAVDPNDSAKTTLKETQLHDARTGHMSAQPSATGSGSHAAGAVGPQDVMRTTVRETGHRASGTRNLAAPDVHKSVVYDPSDVARPTTRQTTLNQPRTANADAQAESGMGYMTNPKEAPNTNRQFVSTVEYTGDADGPEVGGYQVAETEAPATQRQAISDNAYAGGAKSSDGKPMSYADVYNATLNEVKEQLAEGRQPTLTAQKRSAGAEGVNLDVRPQVSEEESHREWTRTADVALSGRDTPSLGESTRDLNTLQTTDEGDAPDPALLEAFRNNPLTQPLDSSAL